LKLDLTDDRMRGDVARWRIDGFEQFEPLS
jgi:hypothetical protein